MGMRTTMSGPAEYIPGESAMLRQPMASSDGIEVLPRSRGL